VPQSSPWSRKTYTKGGGVGKKKVLFAQPYNATDQLKGKAMGEALKFQSGKTKTEGTSGATDRTKAILSKTKTQGGQKKLGWATDGRFSESRKGHKFRGVETTATG